jgi:hypothetical protein
MLQKLTQAMLDPQIKDLASVESIHATSLFFYIISLIRNKRRRGSAVNTFHQ